MASKQKTKIHDLPDLNGCTIAIIGLGYVGLPLALEFAKKRNVIAFDIKKKRIKEEQISKKR